MKLYHGINYVEIDETNIKSLIQEIETPVFGYPKKLIMIKNSGLFSKKTNKDFEKQLTNYLTENEKSFKDTVYLVFIEQEINKNTLSTTIEKLGIVCNFERLKPAEIAKRLGAIIKAYGVNISSRRFTIIYWSLPEPICSY